MLGSTVAPGEAGGEAGLAVDGGANNTGALPAERFAAVLAEGGAFAVRMVGAVHSVSSWGRVCCA